MGGVMQSEDGNEGGVRQENNSIRILRGGIIDYAIVDAEMRRLQQLRINDKIPDSIIFVEHPEIVTLGPKSRRDGVVVDASYQTIDIDRGGGITWHGPGQLVVYPIIAWLGIERSVTGVISLLESWIIAALEECGISGHRDDRMQGIWVDGYKVASVGLAFFRWVSRHGFSINIDTPENRVEGLPGCGLPRGTTTSIARLLERENVKGQHDIVCESDVGNQNIGIRDEVGERLEHEQRNEVGERLEHEQRNEVGGGRGMLDRARLEQALLKTAELVLNRKIGKSIQISDQRQWLI